jgi:D-3-phosphoglycerate dehydrogenase / 2-oxoglutarate reductase
VKSKVWTEVPLHPEALARLQLAAEVTTGGTRENLPGARVAVIGASKVDGDFLDHAGSELQMVIRHGVGYNAVDVPAATARGILAANTPDGPTECTAEHAVGMLIGVAKRLVKADRYLRANRPFRREELQGTEVRDQILGVVGYGRVGRRVTEICALGFKMQVLIYDPFLPADTALPDGVTQAGSLEALLQSADFVTLHTPLTAATHHLIGERELRMMKPGAYLINVSRGPVVDEAALIRALQEGHLAGAALDVFDPEPPMPGNPLLQMDNVVVTLHTGGNTIQGSYRMSQGVVDQILQLLAGECPTNLLDAAAWPGRVGSALPA